LIADPTQRSAEIVISQKANRTAPLRIDREV